MDREHFIIRVYCLVCELCQAHRDKYTLRRGGFAPALTDEEVITIELCGEYFKLATDKDIFDYFRAHGHHFFPALTERSLFVRQAANLWQVKAFMHQQLIQCSGQADGTVQIIDTLPLPVCTYTRTKRERCFKPFVAFGHCVAKKMDYYGFKLGLRVSRCGMIVQFPLLPARPHEVNFLGDLLEGFGGGTAPADKGFIDAFRQALLQERQAVLVVTLRRKGMAPSPHPGSVLRCCTRLRKRVETVGSHLVERFAVARLRAHDLWHYSHRLIRKVLSHTVAVFLNLRLGREPLDLDGLVTA